MKVVFLILLSSVLLMACVQLQGDDSLKNSGNVTKVDSLNKSFDVYLDGSMWAPIASSLVDGAVMQEPLPVVSFNSSNSKSHPKYKPLLAISQDGQHVIANSLYFAEVNQVKATKENKVTVAVLTQKLLDEKTPFEIVKFLIDSHIITTYFHMPPELKIENEKDAAKEYSIKITGTHTYCTNECTTAPLNFTITLNKTNKTITLDSK